MIQQHYIDHLKNSDLNLTNKISNCLSHGDILENYIYEKNDNLYRLILYFNVNDIKTPRKIKF